MQETDQPTRKKNRLKSLKIGQKMRKFDQKFTKIVKKHLSLGEDFTKMV